MYPGVPPPAVTVAEPLVLLHIAEEDETVFVRGEGSVMTTVWVEIQPVASVTDMVYVPGPNPVAVGVACTDGDHRYVNGAVPLLVDAVALPVLNPLQAGLTCVTLSEPKPTVIICVVESLFPVQLVTIS